MLLENTYQKFLAVVEAEITQGIMVGLTTKSLRFYRNYLKNQGVDMLFVGVREKEGSDKEEQEKEKEELL